MATISLYSAGSSEYYLTVNGSANGSTIYADANLEPRYSGASFASNHTGTLTIEIVGVTSNVITPSSCSKNSPAYVSTSASVGNGSYTVKATWYVGDGPGAKPASGSVSVTVNVNATTYRKVTYDLDGHGTNFSWNVVNGGNATRPTPDPTDDGYTFVNWYADSGFNTLYDFSSAVTSNITIYAKWVENGVLRVYKNAEWKKAIPYQWISGAWKQEKAMTFKNGEWKRGI